MAANTKIPLSDFQQWMQQMLLDPFQRTEVDANQFLPEEIRGEGFSGIVKGSSKIGAKEHLAIYQRSYIARLRNCMSQQFSALEYALGEDLFCTFADMYLAENPSRHYNLAALGDSFVRFLNEQRPDADAETKEDWIDFMLELASFEHAIGEIFEMKADEDFILADENIPLNELALVPTARLFEFDFPISSFYTQFKQGGNPELPYPRKSYCIVFRHDYRIAIYEISESVYQLFMLLKEELTLIEAGRLTNLSLERFLPLWIKNNFFQIKRAL